MKESLFSLRNALRVIALLLLGVMFFVTIKNSVVISKGNEKIQAQQLETLTKVLSSQAALSASEMIVQKDQEKLLKLTNQLAKERLVFDATVYDSEGVRLASSDKALTAREVLGLDTPLATAGIGRQQLVEPVFADNSIVGFIRITFETGKVTAFSDHHYRKIDRYMFLMILMSFISGMLFILILRKKPQTKVENLLLSHKEPS
ncbi:YtjB family periplasmic protein [Vibrio vulnificus]|uniref:YtjB family periplasmic protein n=1 Tax=Vibrio vulnificus TaxID=672 RepID=UPI001CDD04BD|nr:YtjB family periplasmic protein [Vibrio vulnificus]EGR0055207.1 SMP protein [Vibrio vulnificus]MCA3953193.1 YtjB family periplasmic protein [Vibrio vulnificus]MCU8112720.1 YtjB family periplasmic protein [Vibrio vulnificus]MCU8305161.1 YtjB family periplasmic protein [Vibrio vulnificus]HAU8296859.1 SMP protein [Vibrio vulnificus]